MRQNTTEEKIRGVLLIDTISYVKNCIAVSKENTQLKIIDFISEKGLDFRPFLWYCCVLTGGTEYEKYDKRAMAWKYIAARG